MNSNEKVFSKIDPEWMEKFAKANDDEQMDMTRPLSAVMGYKAGLFNSNGMTAKQAAEFEESKGKVVAVMGKWVDLSLKGGDIGDILIAGKAGVIPDFVRCCDIWDETEKARDFIAEYLAEGVKDESK